MATKSAPAATEVTEQSVPVSAISELVQALRPKTRITIANRTARNPMNPTNRVRKLTKDFYQNFSKIDVDDLTDEEFDLFPKLREGNFIPDSREGYLVEVIDVKRGAHRGMHLRYNNGSIDQRMGKLNIPLAEILRKCIAEYVVQRDERKARAKAEAEE